MALESKAVKDHEIAMWADLAKVAKNETKGIYMLLIGINISIRY